MTITETAAYASLETDDLVTLLEIAEDVFTDVHTLDRDEAHEFYGEAMPELRGLLLKLRSIDALP
jgi:hypothetical protein